MWFDGLRPFVAPDAKSIHKSLRGQADALYNIHTLARALAGYRAHICPTLCYEDGTDHDAAATEREGLAWLFALGTDPATRHARWWQDHAMAQLSATLGGSPEACDAMGASAPARLPRRAEDPSASKICADVSAGCASYAGKGECDHNPKWMTLNCRKSCGFCTAGEVDRSLFEDDDEAGGCNDKHEHCADWAAKGECSANPGFMLSSCAKSCKQCSEVVVEVRGGEAEDSEDEYHQGEWAAACALYREYLGRGADAVDAL